MGSSVQSPAERSHIPAIWGMSAGVAALGTAITFDALPGVNWGLWTTAASLALAATIRRARGRVSREITVLLALACALAFGAVLTESGMFHFLIVVSVATLLAVAMLLAAGEPLDRVGLGFIARAPLVGAGRAALEAVRRTNNGVEILRGRRSASVVRGTVIALPIVGVLALLLSQADPVLSAWRDGLSTMIAQWTFVPRLVFFCALGALTLGACGAALRPAPDGSTTAHTPSARSAWTMSTMLLGDTERLIVLGAVSTLFALFLALQVSYFFGSAPALVGSGITYAEYARRGFGELTIAASLTTLLIIGLDRFAVRGARERYVRLVALALVALVQLLLDSAYRRVNLYEQAYGYTAARLHAQAYMVVVSLVLIMLGVEIWGAIDIKRLGRRAALLGAGALLVLVCWNHEAWIARQNITRYGETGKVDVRYLVAGLSPNALPVVMQSLSRLSASDANTVRECLRKHYVDGRGLQKSHHWYEWNLRRTRAWRALQASGIDLTTPITEAEAKKDPYC
jgi:hypothetical protein